MSITDTKITNIPKILIWLIVCDLKKKYMWCNTNLETWHTICNQYLILYLSIVHDLLYPNFQYKFEDDYMYSSVGNNLE